MSTAYLDRPGDMAFGCLASTQGDAGVELVARPLSACGAEGDAGAAEPAAQFGFIVEAPRGDVVVARLAGGELRDSDKLSPGLNGLAVGRLPVAIATTPDGCFAVTANSGSCDLGVIDVLDAIDCSAIGKACAPERADAVTRTAVTSSAGPLAVRPRAIAALPSLPAESELACTDAPSGTVFVAFPACRLVARVDLATGAVIDGVLLDGSGAIAGPDVACPAECAGGAGGALAQDAGAPEADAGSPAMGVVGEPVALVVEPDGSRLYVGAWDSPELVVVDLEAGAPVAVASVPLEGAVGLTRLAASGEVEMSATGEAGKFRFVYAVARDGAVHVADVTPGRPARECDTQVDRRHLRGLSDIGLLACLPVGDPATPPRRAGARGPGIRLPDGAVPLDVAFFKGSQADVAGDDPAPGTLGGVFALVTAVGPQATAPRGTAYRIDVDDDLYPDVEDAGDPRAVDMQLAVPHVLRDSVTGRRAFAEGCTPTTYAGSTDGPVRIEGDPLVQQGLKYNFNGSEGDPLVPMLHRVKCDDTHAVWELAAVKLPDAARDAELVALRERLFADLGQIPTETWTVAWEGALVAKGSPSRRGGGRLTASAGGLVLDDASGLFCELGVEDGDFVQLLGCGSDGDCALGETCFLHPEAPAGVAGMCLPAARVEELSTACRGLLTTARRYTAVEVGSDRLALVPRADVLTSTPIGGCADAAQCQAIHEDEVAAEETASGLAPGSLARRALACEVESGRGDEARCVFACDAAADCRPGAGCQEGRCVLGPIPDAACLAPLQRYEVHAGEAFTVTGSTSGYLHRRIEEVGTGACIDDPAASPLLIGRFRRDEPACDDDPLALAPNPCRLEGLLEPVTSGSVLAERPTWAIRFASVGLAFDVADVAIPLPSSPGEHYSPVPDGYLFRFIVSAGFAPWAEAMNAAVPERIRTGPDGALWIIDAGDVTVATQSVPATRGRVFRSTATGVTRIDLF